MEQTKMSSADDARVMALLHDLTDHTLNDLQAETLYNDIVARILRVPAEYQVALGMQIAQDSALPLTTLQAERFVTCVLFCLCYTDDAGKPGYQLVTREQVTHWHGQFAPFFAGRTAALEQLITALRASGTMPQ